MILYFLITKECYLDKSKFLSHRLLGYGSEESTIEALIHAMNSNAPRLEVDTRVSKDGVIYINHNPTIESKRSSLTIAKSSSKKIDKFINKHALSTPKLDDFLSVYTKRKNKRQILMLDIKDFGFEKEHVFFVNKHKLEKNIAWVSWIPQSLLRLDKLSPNSTKILSYMPVNDFFANFTRNISIKKVPFIPIVLIGEYFYKKPLGNFTHGYQHAYFSKELNQELILMLSKNGGGVCISKKILTKELIAFNRSHNLKTAVFAAQDRREYTELSNFGADIIFCDFTDSELS